MRWGDSNLHFEKSKPLVTVPFSGHDCHTSPFSVKTGQGNSMRYPRDSRVLLSSLCISTPAPAGDQGQVHLARQRLPT